MNNQHPPPDHHSDAAIASIWLFLLALVAVIELVSLLISHTMLTTLH